MVLNTSLPAVMATPTDGTFVAGTGGAAIINQAVDNVTDVTVAGMQSVIHWNSLDTVGGLPADRESLNFFDGGHAGAAVLNRVMSGLGTQFYGDLNAEAGMRIFMVNPAGIVFGQGSTVNVTQLIASNLDISDSQFLAGDYEFVGDIDGVEVNERLGVINNGIITTTPNTEGVTEGVALIGQKILNTGTITTGAGGFVVMAAGDRVLLGEPGSKIVVEMDSVTLTDPENPDGFGNVVNEGTIAAPGGTVTLAAGDIFSVPLHPQLKVNSGTDEVPEYKAADQPVRVESGLGTVTQSGTVNADGGSVVMTASDDVILASGSTTQAIDGEVIAYAYDFGTKEATTSFEDGAAINVGTGFAEICGNHILFAGSVDAAPGGTIQVDPLTLTIADTMPVTGPELDTLYEEDIESYSQAGVNLDLAADEMITVEYMTDGQIAGGSGDITLRNIYADGGIYFEQQNEDTHTGPRSTIRTIAYYESAADHRDGGNIYMDAGSEGIVAGNLFTGTLSQDKVSQPGEIVLRTANGGDIEVGTMRAEGANSTQVSAISDGDLIVNGNVESINKQTDNQVNSVFSARGCLIAEGDIHLNGTNYEVYSHGKGELVSDIRISAGENVYIGSAQAPATIKAESKVAQSGIATKSTAYIVIHAGRNLEGSGTIEINGQSYTPDQAYLTGGSVSALALSAGVDTSNTPSSSVDTKTVWEDLGSTPADFFAKIEINSNETTPLNEGPCKDCPQPPGLPPVPTLFIIFDDSFAFAKNAENESVDVLDNDNNGAALVDGIVWEYTTTTAGGLLEELPGSGDVTSFEYTPPADAVFVWDGSSPYAEFTDTFTYKAKDAEGNISVNTATVTITVKNFLPVADGGFATTPKADNVDVTEAAAAGSDLIEFVIGSDLDPEDSVWVSSYEAPANGTLEPIYDTVDPTKIIGFTYDPPDDLSAASFDGTGVDDAYDSFTYTVTDGDNFSTATVENPGAVQINLTNELPVAKPDSYDVLHNVNLSQTADQGIVTGVVPAVNGDTDADGDSLTPYLPGELTTGSTALGGTITLNSDGSFTYEPPADTVDTDSFTYYVNDGYNNSESVQVTIDLTNTSPVAQPDSYGVGHNVSLSPDADQGIIVGVIPVDNGDYDPDEGDSLTPFLTGGLTTGATAQNGQITLNEDGSFTYEPPSDYVGSDSFTYYVSDEYGSVSDEVQVSIEVGNSSPVAQADSYDVLHNVDLSQTADQGIITGVDPVANGDTDVDGDSLTPYLPGALTSGLTDLGGTITLNQDGSFTYDPPADTVGTDGFTYYVTDGYSNSETVQVTINLTNTTPVAQPDNYHVVYDTPLSTLADQGVITGVIPAVNGDYDPDPGDVLTPFLAGGLTTGSTDLGGTVTLNPDGSFTYTPASDFSGTDTFTYYVTDGYGDSESVQVTMYVDSPVIAVPYMQPAPGLQREEIKISGCPALVQWMASELGTDESQIQVWMANSLASDRGIPACDACANLKQAATVLQDVDGTRVAALAGMINQFASSTAPPTEEQMASIADAIANDIEGNSQYAAAGEYLDALAMYVGILSSEMGFTADESVQFATDNYVGQLVEGEEMGVAAYVAARLADLAGSE